MTSAVKTQFVTKIEDEKVIEAMNGQREITMTMWMKADAGRTIFKALSPANLEYEHWREACRPYQQQADGAQSQRSMPDRGHQLDSSRQGIPCLPPGHEDRHGGCRLLHRPWFAVY